MAILFDAAVDPDDLTAFVREVPLTRQHTFLDMFPRRDVRDNQVDFAEIVRTNRTARYRSWDGRLHVSARDTASEKKVKLPPLSSSLSMGEYERLQYEFARTGGTRTAAYVAAIYDDATNLTNEVLNRYEMAWGDVLNDGILSINENGLVSTADFGVPADHKITVGTSWATIASAPVLDDLIAALDVYIATNGFPPGQIRTSQKTIRRMTQNAQLINAVKGAAAGVTRLTLAELGGVFDSVGLPPIGAPIDHSFDVDGVTTRVLPEDKLLFLPPNLDDLGYSAWGLTATALELVNSNEADMSFEEAPGIVGVVEKDGPPYRSWTFVDACGMPILSNAKRLMIIDTVP